MEHTSQADKIFTTYTRNMWVKTYATFVQKKRKHMQHPDKTLATCNTKTLTAI
jgi:hypothetical protein